MKRTWLCISGAALLLAAGCGGNGGSGGAVLPTLVLGAPLALSGSLAHEGLLTREGYDVCREAVNGKGGVRIGDHNMQIRIDYRDDTSQPDIAAKLVNDFNDTGIKLMLGPYGSGTTGAAAAAIERNGQVMAEGAGADDAIFAKGYRRTFAVLAPASAYAASMVQAISELARPRPQTFAFVSADDGFSKTATKGGVAKAQSLGFTVVATEYVKSGTSDVSAALGKVRPKNPDVIIGSVHLAEGIAIVKQSADLGLRPAGAFAETVAPPTPDFVDALGARAEGVLGSTQWTTKTAGTDKWFGTAADYDATFTRLFGGRHPEYHAAEASAACLAMVLALEKAGSTEPDRVRDALATLDEPSFFGPLRFSASGMNVAKTMPVVQIQGGKPVTVWPKESAEGDLHWPATA